MRELPQVTLIGVDCIDSRRLLRAASICQRSIRFGEVRILSSQSSGDARVVPIAPLRSIEEYSSFMIKEVAQYVATQFALVIQHDGFILNPEGWRDAYLDYDYIGAPWLVDGRDVVGNGGFSLRSRRLMALLRQDNRIPEPRDVPEDWYICVVMRSYLETKGIRFAPVDLAKQFSLEGGNDGVTFEWTDQFGFHGLGCTDITSWIEKNSHEVMGELLEGECLALKVRLEMSSRSGVDSD